jgi:hypothetical protein
MDQKLVYPIQSVTCPIHFVKRTLLAARLTLKYVHSTEQTGKQSVECLSMLLVYMTTIY